MPTQDGIPAFQNCSLASDVRTISAQENSISSQISSG